MHSLSKTPVATDALHEIVRHQFGSVLTLRHAEELKEGFFNAAFLLELDDGRRYVLKVAPPDSFRILGYEKNIMKTEVDVIRLIRAHTQVPAPEIYGYDTSRRCIDSDYFLMDYLSGTPLHKVRGELSSDDNAAIDHEMGRILSQINAIGGQRFGYHALPEKQFATWREAFPAMLAGMLDDGRDKQVKLPLSYDDLFDQASRLFGALDDVTHPQLVHWDLWDGNVFIDPATQRITGLIDFERALWGDPLMEFNFREYHETGSFIEGYGDNLLASPTARQRRTLYNLYLYLIMIIECYYRYYPTQDQENWARARLDEELVRLAAYNTAGL